MFLHTTDEQQRQALKQTYDACVAVRDLCRQLDLPLSAFESVVEMYHTQLHGIAMAAEDARQHKVSKIMRARAQEFYRDMPRRPHIGRQMVGGLIDEAEAMPAHLIEDVEKMTDEQLGAEIAKLASK